MCLCVPCCSRQRCLSRTSPCTWQCPYPIPMPCTSQEGLWVARPWPRLRPPSATVGCSRLHRLPCTGTWARAAAPRGPPVQAVQVSGPYLSQVVNVADKGRTKSPRDGRFWLLCPALIRGQRNISRCSENMQRCE